MKFFYSFLFLLLAALSATGQQLEEYQRKLFVQEGDSLPYRILYPQQFDSSRKYPLVIILHGAGERGKDNEAQLVYGAKLFLEPTNQQQYPAIVVFPQCPKDSYWSNVKIVTNADKSRTFNYQKKVGTPTKAMQALMGLVKELQASSQVEQDQIYIGGLSMGGMGTFEILRRMPGTFAAAFTICGGGHPRGAKAYARTVPLWVFHGEKDRVVPVEKSAIMVEALKKAGGNVKYTVYPGVDHNSWENAFAEPELLPWLYSHRRSK